MSSLRNQKQNFEQSLSLDDVSKLFPLSISEAAEILGVSTSVLKKLCNDNGLERWPNRQYLAGKSIEEIKAEAAKEKSKALGANSQADKQKSNGAIGSVSSLSPGSNVKDKTTRSVSEMSKTTWQTHQILASGLAMEASSCSEEFKYGFPSSGLSRSTNKWWGSGCDSDESSKNVAKTASDASKTQVENSIMEKNKVSLTAIRKRALDEGQKALKSGALKKHGVDQLGNEEKILLRRLFQTS